MSSKSVSQIFKILFWIEDIDIFSYNICYENIGRKHNKIPTLKSTDRRPWTDRTEQYGSKEECIK